MSKIQRGRDKKRQNSFKIKLRSIQPFNTAQSTKKRLMMSIYLLINYKKRKIIHFSLYNYLFYKIFQEYILFLHFNVNLIVIFNFIIIYIQNQILCDFNY
jgi:hypothetical protein